LTVSKARVLFIWESQLSQCFLIGAPLRPRRGLLERRRQLSGKQRTTLTSSSPDVPVLSRRVISVVTRVVSSMAPLASVLGEKFVRRQVAEDGCEFFFGFVVLGLDGRCMLDGRAQGLASAQAVLLGP